MSDGARIQLRVSATLFRCSLLLLSLAAFRATANAQSNDLGITAGGYFAVSNPLSLGAARHFYPSPSFCALCGTRGRTADCRFVQFFNSHLKRNNDCAQLHLAVHHARSAIAPGPVVPGVSLFRGGAGLCPLQSPALQWGNQRQQFVGLRRGRRIRYQHHFTFRPARRTARL